MAVFSAAMNNLIRLNITPEFANELKRHHEKVSADPILQFAEQLPTLPNVSVEIVQPLIHNSI